MKPTNEMNQWKITLSEAEQMIRGIRGQIALELEKERPWKCVVCGGTPRGTMDDQPYCIEHLLAVAAEGGLTQWITKRSLTTRS